MRTVRFAVFAVTLLLAACSAPDGTPPEAAAREPGPAALGVEVIAGGLTHPWDIGFLPDGTALIPQRSGKLGLLAGNRPGAQVRPVRADLSDVFARGEGGLMGLLVHPDFASTRQFLTCRTHQENGRPVDVRLINWRLAEDGGNAQRVGPPLVTGLPVNQGGRHSGCRLALAEDGSLLVTTGDSANPGAAQDRHGLGGKVLRMDLRTGEPLPDNPFSNSPDPAERLIYTYGHRNAQGIAPRPGGQVVVAEHGPDRDDELNVLSRAETTAGTRRAAAARTPTTSRCR